MVAKANAVLAAVAAMRRVAKANVALVSAALADSDASLLSLAGARRLIADN